MKANLIPAFVTAALSVCLVSCDEFNELTIQQKAPSTIPEMPYRPSPTPATPESQEEEQPAPTTTWETAPPADSFISRPTPPPAPESKAPKIPDPAPVNRASTPKPTPLPEPAAAPAPAPKPAEAVKPIRPLEESPFTAPAAPTAAPEPIAPAPAAPAPATASAADLKNITNNGPIPTAARVEGDPTRVWNPLDPSKKIRIINPKTNQPYPSGKKLKVRGTNFQFYVP